MRRLGTRSLRRTRGAAHAGCAAAALLLALLPGCVGRGTYNEVLAERDGLAADKRRLSERVRQLEASSQSLDSERIRLIDELEDLRIAREGLERDVSRLERSEARLSENLEAREAELAATSEVLDGVRGTYETLVADLEAEVASGQIQIERLREGLRLNVAQDILFASGSTTLSPGGRQVLRKVAARLKDLPHRVEIQGHTDDVPVRASARFPSNWEVAAARASGVVRLLADSGVDGARLVAVSYGEFHPIADNGTPEGRLRNRRIEIRLELVEEEAAPLETALEAFEPEADEAQSVPAAPAAAALDDTVESVSGAPTSPDAEARASP